MTKIQKKALLRALITTKDYSALATTMAAPIAHGLYYTSIARKAFIIENLCWLCKKVTKSKKFYYEDFATTKKRGDRHAPGNLYRLCMKCCKETRKQLQELNALSIEQIPLYINDDNIFIEKRAIERLRKGK